MWASILAFRVDQRVGADPLDRRRGRQDGSRVTAGLDEPAHQVLVRLRPWRFFAEPVPELMRLLARSAQGRHARRLGSSTASAATSPKRLDPLACISARIWSVP